MTILSDEELLKIWHSNQSTSDDLPLLRAVADAAVKDALSDWCVSDSVIAGQIMNVFGYAHDPSFEPAADPLRDKIAAMIYRHRNAVMDAAGGAVFGYVDSPPEVQP